MTVYIAKEHRQIPAKEAPMVTIQRLIYEAHEKFTAVQFMLELLPKCEFESDLLRNQLLEIQNVINSGLNNLSGNLKRLPVGNYMRLENINSVNIGEGVMKGQRVPSLGGGSNSLYDKSPICCPRMELITLQ